jgi:membrane-associated phospholipid phosphatase
MPGRLASRRGAALSDAAAAATTSAHDVPGWIERPGGNGLPDSATAAASAAATVASAADPQRRTRLTTEQPS